MITLTVQGAANAQAIFDCFAGSGVTWTEARGGWHRLALRGWAGTDYAALVHARQMFPGVRIFCPTAPECPPWISASSRAP